MKEQMTLNEILDTLLKSWLLLLATIALRDIWQRVAISTGIKAWGETQADLDIRLFPWLLAKWVSCPVCSTYWLGMLAAICIWPLPLLGFWYQTPVWLLGGLSAAWLVNHFSEESNQKWPHAGHGCKPINFAEEQEKMHAEMQIEAQARQQVEQQMLLQQQLDRGLQSRQRQELTAAFSAGLEPVDLDEDSRQRAADNVRPTPVKFPTLEDQYLGAMAEKMNVTGANTGRFESPK